MGYEYWVSSLQPDWLAPQGSGHAAICAHMATLLASGFVVRSGAEVQFAVPDHPLAKALSKLIRQGAKR